MNNILKELYQDFKDTNENFKDDKKKHIPNILTMIRLLSVPIVIGLFISGNILATLIVASLASFTDFMDGQISRKLNAHSKFGSKLDTVADKTLGTTLALINLMLSPIFILTIALEIMIGFINVYAHTHNKSTKTNQVGRVKTVVLYTTLLLGVATKLVPILLPITFIGICATTLYQVKALNQYISDYFCEKKVNKEIITEKKESKIEPKKDELTYYKNLKNNLLRENDIDKQKTL
jgi:phosphatidylglycerophosphate synthase